jgi:hypothetical protein
MFIGIQQCIDHNWVVFATYIICVCDYTLLIRPTIVFVCDLCCNYKSE